MRDFEDTDFYERAQSRSVRVILGWAIVVAWSALAAWGVITVA